MVSSECVVVVSMNVEGIYTLIVHCGKKKRGQVPGNNECMWARMEDVYTR